MSFFEGSVIWRIKAAAHITSVIYNEDGHAPHPNTEWAFLLQEICLEPTGSPGAQGPWIEPLREQETWMRDETCRSNSLSIQLGFFSNITVSGRKVIARRFVLCTAIRNAQPPVKCMGHLEGACPVLLPLCEVPALARDSLQPKTLTFLYHFGC